MGDNLTIVICIAVAIAVILFTGKQRKDYSTRLEQYKENAKNYQKASFTKSAAVLVLIMTLIAIAILIYGIVTDIEYVWISLLLLVMCVSEYMLLPTRYDVYYTDNDFFIDKGKVLYRNIKGYEFNKLMPRRSAVTIKLYSGEDVIVSQKAYQFIEEQIKLQKEKKKELKESRKKHAA